MNLHNKIKELTKNFHQEMIATRRYLQQHPEVSSLNLNLINSEFHMKVHWKQVV